MMKIHSFNHNLCQSDRKLIKTTYPELVAASQQLYATEFKQATDYYNLGCQLIQSVFYAMKNMKAGITFKCSYSAFTWKSFKWKLKLQ